MDESQSSKLQILFDDDFTMIDTVAKAIMQWAVPFNDWDSQAEERRERWRGAARVAIDAVREWEGEVREGHAEPYRGTLIPERVYIPADQIMPGTTSHFRRQERGKDIYWRDVAPEFRDGYAIFTLTDDKRFTPADG